MVSILIVLICLLILSFFHIELSIWCAIALFIDAGGLINNSEDLLPLRFILPFFIAFVPPLLYSRYKSPLKGFIAKPAKLFLPFGIYIILIYSILLNNEDINSFKDILYLLIYVSIFPLIPLIYRSVVVSTIRKPLLPIWVFVIYSSIIGVFFVLTVQFGFDILSFNSGVRHGQERIIVYQYGNQIYSPFMLLPLLLLPKSKPLLSFLIMLSVGFGLYILMLDMSRGSYINLLLMAFVVFGLKFWSGYGFKMHRIIIVFFVFSFVLSTYLSSYFDKASLLFSDTYLAITTNETSEGREEVRFTKDLAKHLVIFERSPIFGHGYTTKWYKNALDDYSASDFPLSGGIAMFGVFGAFFYFYFIIGLFKYFFDIFLLIKRCKTKDFTFTLAIVFVFFGVVISRYLIPFYYFQEVIRVQSMLIYFVFIGIGSAYFHLFLNQKRLF